MLRSYGTDGFRKHLEKVGYAFRVAQEASAHADRQGIDHCRHLTAVVRASPAFELVTKPSLGLLVFRLRPVGHELPDSELNLLNQQLHTRLTARYDVFLTQTILQSLEREIFCIRFSIGSANTTLEDVLATWRVVEAEGDEVLKAWEALRAV